METDALTFTMTFVGGKTIDVLACDIIEVTYQTECLKVTYNKRASNGKVYVDCTAYPQRLSQKQP
jgi:hypothetical protein